MVAGVREKAILAGLTDAAAAFDKGIEACFARRGRTGCSAIHSSMPWLGVKRKMHATWAGAVRSRTGQTHSWIGTEHFSCGRSSTAPHLIAGKPQDRGGPQPRSDAVLPNGGRQARRDLAIDAAPRIVVWRCRPARALDESCADQVARSPSSSEQSGRNRSGVRHVHRPAGRQVPDHRGQDDAATAQDGEGRTLGVEEPNPERS